MKPNALNADQASPLYRQLMAHLRSDITSGVYPVHSRIPSEPELCESYQVSRVTVRKALAELTRDGLLERHQGKGTYVCIPRIQRDLRMVNSFTDYCRSMGCVPGNRVISAKLVPAEDDADALHCEPGDLVLEVQRLRLADDTPVMLEINRYPEAYAWLKEEDLTGSLYSLLREHGVTPGQASHEVSLCYASAAEARLLEVAPDSALLCLDEVIYDQQGHPLHTSRQHIRGDRFVFRI